MQSVTPDSPEAMARVAIMMMVTDAEVDERELEMLERMHAFRRLGITKTAFMREAKHYMGALGQRMGERPFLRLDDVELIDSILDGVRDAGKRLMVARIAAGLVTADGRVREIERLVLERMLLRWGLAMSDVTRAIREAPAD